MTDDELRALVREVISRTRGGTAGAVSLAPPSAGIPLPRDHASHGLFVLPTGIDSDGPCIIEPAVTCNHCGYCKSYGH